MRSVLLLPLVARFLDNHVCIWCMFVFMSAVVTVCVVMSGAVGARVWEV